MVYAKIIWVAYDDDLMANRIRIHIKDNNCVALQLSVKRHIQKLIENLCQSIESKIPPSTFIYLCVHVYYIYMILQI